VNSKLPEFGKFIFCIRFAISFSTGRYFSTTVQRVFNHIAIVKEFTLPLVFSTKREGLLLAQAIFLGHLSAYSATLSSVFDLLHCNYLRLKADTFTFSLVFVKICVGLPGDMGHRNAVAKFKPHSANQ
jgi:hypothetical protein